MEISNDYKEMVIMALMARRENFGGKDVAFAKSMDIDKAVFSQLKKGKREKLLSQSEWLRLGRILGVNVNKRKWNTVETEVFTQIKEEIIFCQEHSRSMIFVDNCGIGKTYTAKYLANSLKNCFYIDCTQCKTQREFIKALARAVGVEQKGKLSDIKADTKYYLSSVLHKPVMIIDEAGALEKSALGLLQEYWNATEGFSGWYVMGANALRNKMNKGVANDKDYFAELFSRLSENFSDIVPKEKNEKKNFYTKLIKDVLSANITDKSKLDDIVKRSLVDINGSFSGLRRAESLIILYGC